MDRNSLNADPHGAAQVEKEVRDVKTLRAAIDAQTQAVKAMPSTRERALAITKLQDATMWLGMDLKRIGEQNPGLVQNPYPHSKYPSTTQIAPTADGLKM